MSSEETGVVAVNMRGEYATISRPDTHTGTKIRVCWTRDLNGASVIGAGELIALNRNHNLVEAVAIVPAKSERKVTLLLEKG